MARWRARWVLVGLAIASCSTPVADHHRPFPQVGTLDGALLSPLRLVTIVPQNDQVDAEALFAFSERVAGSQWWARVAPEYHLGAITIASLVTGPAITTDMTDHDLFEYVDALVTSNPSITRDGHSVYLLYLPPAIVIIRDGKPNTGCDQFGAYHVSYGIRGDNLAFMQRCTEDQPIANLTVAAAHEIFESATDPDNRGYRLPQIAAQPWTEPIANAFDLTGGEELADLCVGSFWEESGQVYQRMWSNAAARRGGDPCVPALSEPFYDTDFDQDWYPVPAGGAVSIPVMGWATGSLGAWPVSTFVQSDTQGFEADLRGQGTLTAGATSELDVHAPAGAVSGSFALIGVSSDRPDHAVGTRGLTDGGHVNFVGVYVP